LGVWLGLLEALPLDKIELLDCFLESLIFSTPLGEKTLRKAANTGRIAKYAGWKDEVNEEELMQEPSNEDQEVLEQALEEDIKLELNDGRADDSFHARNFMEDNEV
jgi:hypothetical protein